MNGKGNNNVSKYLQDKQFITKEIISEKVILICLFPQVFYDSEVRELEVNLGNKGWGVGKGRI